MSEVRDLERPSGLEEVTEDAASRKRFLKMVGGAGAAGALSIFIAACGGDDEKKSESGGSTAEKKARGGGDLEIVNYALTLEYVEVDFYGEVIDSGKIKDRKTTEVLKRIHANEEEHAAALEEAAKKLGTPAKKPKTNFDKVLAAPPKMILETAAEIENLGAAAYLGQAGRIQSTEILAAALSIHTIEGRQAGVLNTLIGKSPVPDGAFAKPASMDEVLPKVNEFLA
jgi:rubrerythrin